MLFATTMMTKLQPQHSTRFACDSLPNRAILDRHMDTHTYSAAHDQFLLPTRGVGVGNGSGLSRQSGRVGEKISCACVLFKSRVSRALSDRAGGGESLH